MLDEAPYLYIQEQDTMSNFQFNTEIDKLSSLHVYLLLLAGLVCSVTLASCSVLSSDSEPESSKLFLGERSLPSPSMNGVPDSVSSAYRQDAKVIALRYIERTDSAKVRIPEGTIEFFWRGLIHVYNYDHPARDTVVHKYTVHNPGTDALYRELLVRVDTSNRWTNAWRNGETKTGNRRIDQLIEKYELTLDSQRLINSSLFVVLRSDDPINPKALARTFEEEVPEIIDASANELVRGYSYIKARVLKERLIYTYSLGWGDCPAGCIYRRNWEFVLYPSGAVSFNESYGDPLMDAGS